MKLTLYHDYMIILETMQQLYYTCSEKLSRGATKTIKTNAQIYVQLRQDPEMKPQMLEDCNCPSVKELTPL